MSSRKRSHDDIASEVSVSSQRTEILTTRNVDTTAVCNVKVAHIRPKYISLKEWFDDPHNVYIGRAGVVFVNGERFPKKHSIWANPFKVGKDGSLNTILKKFEAFIRNKIEKENLESSLELLRYCNLGCWCVNSTTCQFSADYSVNVCHGQVLLKLLNESKLC